MSLSISSVVHRLQSLVYLNPSARYPFRYHHHHHHHAYFQLPLLVGEATPES
jgi:hypothetical protein